MVFLQPGTTGHKKQIVPSRRSPDSCLWPSLMPHSHEIDSMKLLSRPPHISLALFSMPQLIVFFSYYLPSLISALSSLAVSRLRFLWFGFYPPAKGSAAPMPRQASRCFYLHGLPKCWWEQGADSKSDLKG